MLYAFFSAIFSYVLIAWGLYWLLGKKTTGLAFNNHLHPFSRGFSNSFKVYALAHLANVLLLSFIDNPQLPEMKMSGKEILIGALFAIPIAAIVEQLFWFMSILVIYKFFISANVPLNKSFWLSATLGTLVFAFMHVPAWGMLASICIFIVSLPWAFCLPRYGLWAIALAHIYQNALGTLARIIYLF